MVLFGAAMGWSLLSGGEKNTGEKNSSDDR
jgi:hypothetical protein